MEKFTVVKVASDIALTETGRLSNAVGQEIRRKGLSLIDGLAEMGYEITDFGNAKNIKLIKLAEVSETGQPLYAKVEITATIHTAKQSTKEKAETEAVVLFE